MTNLVEQIVELHEALSAAGTSHAFGGALALAFHTTEPRGTRDIDLNVFVGADHDSVSALLASLPAGVVWADVDVESAVRDGQVRVFWGETPVDLFFSTHPFHDVAEERCLTVPFAGSQIPVLGADELAVFKAFFARSRDWADLEDMSDSGTLDVHRVLGWLVDLLGAEDERVARFSDLLNRPVRATEEPRFTT